MTQGDSFGRTAFAGRLRGARAAAGGAMLAMALIMLAGPGRAGDAPSGLPCPAASTPMLPAPAPLQGAAAGFDRRLRQIVAARDLAGFLALLHPEVLVSFGGDGGLAEFQAHWALERPEGAARLWAVLEQLLQLGAGARPDEPDALSYPWQFVNWPAEEEAYDIWIPLPGARLRTAPALSAPALAGAPGQVLRALAEPEGEWLAVAAPGLCPAYLPRTEAVPLLGPRLMAWHEGGRWQIEALVAGD